jgi:hypothetical protein
MHCIVQEHSEFPSEALAAPGWIQVFSAMAHVVPGLGQVVADLAEGQ